jgi:hypothetical protein
MRSAPSGKFVAHAVAGVRIPDSKLALDATEMVREASSASLFNHVLRTYLFGELLGRRFFKNTGMCSRTRPPGTVQG